MLQGQEKPVRTGGRMEGEVLEEKLPRVQSSSPLRGILQNISNLL